MSGIPKNQPVPSQHRFLGISLPTRKEFFGPSSAAALTSGVALGFFLSWGASTPRPLMDRVIEVWALPATAVALIGFKLLGIKVGQPKKVITDNFFKTHKSQINEVVERKGAHGSLISLNAGFEMEWFRATVLVKKKDEEEVKDSKVWKDHYLKPPTLDDLENISNEEAINRAHHDLQALGLTDEEMTQFSHQFGQWLMFASQDAIREVYHETEYMIAPHQVDIPELEVKNQDTIYKINYVGGDIQVTIQHISSLIPRDRFSEWAALQASSKISKLVEDPGEIARANKAREEAREMESYVLATTVVNLKAGTGISTGVTTISPPSKEVPKFDLLT